MRRGDEHDDLLAAVAATQFGLPAGYALVGVEDRHIGLNHLGREDTRRRPPARRTRLVVDRRDDAGEHPQNNGAGPPQGAPYDLALPATTDRLSGARVKDFDDLC